MRMAGQPLTGGYALTLHFLDAKIEIEWVMNKNKVGTLQYLKGIARETARRKLYDFHIKLG